MLESYDSTIALRSNGNQALKHNNSDNAEKCSFTFVRPQADVQPRTGKDVGLMVKV